MVKLKRDTQSGQNSHNMSTDIDTLREIDELDFMRGDKVTEKDRPTVEKLSVAL
jgi:hypothetical protein